MAPDPFADLYGRTYPRVWSALGRLGVKRTAEREELAQDVYLIAHQKKDGRDPQVPELAWVLTITKNVAQNHRKLLRTRKETLVEDPESPPELPSGGATPEQIATGRQDYLSVVEGLLPERREVFELHEVEGFTAPEIAATLGIPEGTVNSRLRLAREDVRAAKARRERAGMPAALPLPFGTGAWQSVRDAFDDGAAEARDRVWRGVERGLERAAVVAALGGTGGAGAVVGGVAAAKASAGALVAGGFALGGLVVGAVMLLVRLPAQVPPAGPVAVEARPRSAEIADAPAAPSSEAAVDAGVPGSVASVAIPTARPATSAPPTAAAATSQIDPEEMALIARAQVAFSRRDQAGTLEALDAHARRFPRGKLAHEREDIRAELKKVAGTWAPQPAKGPESRDGGRGRVFGSDD